MKGLQRYIQDGLRAIEERDAIIERWMRDDVAPTYDAHNADPGRASTLADVVARLDTYMDGAETKAC